MGSDFDESFAPKSQHGYVKALWASRGFIRWYLGLLVSAVP